jgi:ATP-dependent Lon protease
VRESVRRTRRRADLPARKFRERIAEGTLRIETRGAVVGQVNGLAVTQVGPLTYGFPARITATIAPGHGGTVNIERESELSGAIHTKGFFILGGLLRHLLRGAGHPLSFTASIAFEQSYGGIDGDSASGAEICCLLSALTGVPLRQGLAMTGAIDQFGHVQPIGAVSEKIEGFYDTCSDAGLTGDQGVIVPRSNVVDLMLRHDVVEACAAGRFHVFGVEDVGEALELFTGLVAGSADASGRYPPGSLLARAIERAGVFWREAREGPREPGRVDPPRAST